MSNERSSNPPQERPPKRLKQGSLSSFFLPRGQSLVNPAEQQPEATEPDAVDAVSETEVSDQDSESDVCAKDLPLCDVGQPVFLLGHLFCRQVQGCSTDTLRCFRQSTVKAYKEVFAEDLHNCGGFRGEGPGHVSALDLDNTGELLVSTDDYAHIAIHHYSNLRNHFLNRNALLEPALVIANTVHSVAWIPQDQDWIITTRRRYSDVELYNLTRTQGHPTQTLITGDRDGASAFVSLHGGPFQLAAAGSSGKVYLWDRRAGLKPTGLLRTGSSREPTVFDVDASADGHIVIASTSVGQVVLWDLRGATGGGMTLGPRGPAHRPVLGIVDMPSLIDEVFKTNNQSASEESEMLLRTGLPAIRLNPCDQRSVAFVMGYGTAGILDLVDRSITHMFFDEREPPFPDHYPPGRKPLVWSPCGNTCFFARNPAYIMAVDTTRTGPKPAEPHATSYQHQQIGREGKTTIVTTNPYSSYVPITSTHVPFCIAQHPETLDLVMGGTQRATMIVSVDNNPDTCVAAL